jgi:hypothetical protein
MLYEARTLDRIMTAIELLQQIGLNKYEAEAYYTLLSEGPLTGYELGKRSLSPVSHCRVPISLSGRSPRGGPQTGIEST